MRRWICILILFASLSTLDVFAQTPNYTCADLSNSFNLTSTCETFIACEDIDAVCIQDGVATLLDACSQARLSDCATRTVLYWIVNHHIQMDGLYLFHPDGFQPSLLATVSAFDSGDYETAILEFEDITQSEDYAPYFTLEIAHGILYYANGDYEQAFIHFDKSINTMPQSYKLMISEFDNPIAYYFRGLIYRQWGDEDRALQDFYTYDALASERLKTRLPLSSFRLTLNNVQTYVFYPVFEYAIYGYGYADLTFAEPKPFQLSYRNNDETLVISSLLERRFEETPEIIFLERDPDNPSDYYLDFNAPDIHAKPDTYHLKITVHPTYLNYYETIRHSEGTSTRVGIILPIVEPDIRTIASRRICDNSSLSFLQVEDIVTMNDFNGEVDLIDDPLLNDGFIQLGYDDFEETPYTVIQDPVCFADATWWRISNGTYTGWITESDTWRENFFWNNLSSRYLIMPRHLVEAWEISDSGLFGVPTPLEFLDVIISGE